MRYLLLLIVWIGTLRLSLVLAQAGGNYWCFHRFRNLDRLIIHMLLWSWLGWKLLVIEIFTWRIILTRVVIYVLICEVILWLLLEHFDRHFLDWFARKMTIHSLQFILAGCVLDAIRHRKLWIMTGVHFLVFPSFMCTFPWGRVRMFESIKASSVCI